MKLPTVPLRVLLRVGRWRLMFAAGYESGGYAAQIVWGFGESWLVCDRQRIWRLGFGWDADIPLRPWPARHRKPLEHAPRVHADAWRTDWCAGWCGLYIGVTTYIRRAVVPGSV